MARDDFGVQPDTYSRNSTRSARALRSVRSNLLRRSDEGAESGFDAMGE